MSNEQMLFDFPGQENPPPDLKPLDIKRSVLGWLTLQNPTGFGLGVPTRFYKYKADIAAFWSVPIRKLLRPTRTVIVEIRHHREKCWPDCGRKNELLPLLRQKKEEKRGIEAVIRKNEPHLKDSDTLFAEYESWSYTESTNKDYPAVCKEIEELEHALYNGSRFEQIRRAKVAEHLYLAVPENSVHPHELADGWGLLYINSDYQTKVVKEADSWGCPLNNKMHLIQNIAAQSSADVLFSHGIRVSGKGKIIFTPMPHRRRGTG